MGLHRVTLSTWLTPSTGGIAFVWMKFFARTAGPLLDIISTAISRPVAGGYFRLSKARKMTLRRRSWTTRSRRISSPCATDPPRRVPERIEQRHLEIGAVDLGCGHSCRVHRRFPVDQLTKSIEEGRLAVKSPKTGAGALARRVGLACAGRGRRDRNCHVPVGLEPATSA